MALNQSCISSKKISIKSIKKKKVYNNESNIPLSHIPFKLFTHSLSVRSPPASPPAVSSHPHRNDHNAPECQPLKIALSMPHRRGDPMSQTDQTDNRHLGPCERGAFAGRHQRLSQLGGAKVVGPAEEEG